MFGAGAVTGTVLCRLLLGKAIFFGTFLLFLVFMDLLYADLTKERGCWDECRKGIRERQVSAGCRADLICRLGSLFS